MKKYVKSVRYDNFENEETPLQWTAECDVLRFGEYGMSRAGNGDIENPNLELALRCVLDAVVMMVTAIQGMMLTILIIRPSTSSYIVV
ncbi:hypothetical protein Trydic_g12784 [Trypoxylus dichotomus]